MKKLFQSLKIIKILKHLTMKIKQTVIKNLDIYHKQNILKLYIQYRMF